MATPRRLLFGQVAELYDARRPSYPPALIDDLVRRANLSPGDRVLEVGAGTGKATILFAARGIDVVAIEPSAEMAVVARRNCARYPGVQIIGSDFERWASDDRQFPLVYSAQAWHWIEREAGLERAHKSLATGGLLAPFWNRPAWGQSALRDDLIEVYRLAAPDLEPVGPLHPANPSPLGDEDWVADMAVIDQFEQAEVVDFEWHAEYDADDYVGLLDTLSEIRLLSERERAALVDGVRAAIERHGGTLAMPLRTRLNLARAV